jgi:Protein of unknown function (DUF2630)
MEDDDILARVQQLVDEEHQLRQRAATGELAAAEEQARLRQTEAALDQCWDLLRQRRARRDAGEEATAARLRPAEEVEGYLQ